MQSKNYNPDTTDGIIIPPECDNQMLHDCGESVSTYTPSSYKPFRTTNMAPTLPHPMHGKSTGLSVSKDCGNLSQKSMTEYLNQFKGAYLCLDFWMNSHTKLKKCGVLTEVGTEFLVLSEVNQKRLVVIDLKPVRYINIYCR